MTRIHLLYDRPGKGVTTFEEWLIFDRPDVKVLLLDTFDGDDLFLDGALMLARGAPVIWYVFPDTWYEVGRFHDADDNLTGWYTNLCTPIEMKGDTWRTRDLFLDLWQPVDGNPAWLDEDELRTAVKQRVIDKATHQRIQNERALIALRLAQADWPPPIARDMDLAQVRSLRG